MNIILFFNLLQTYRNCRQEQVDLKKQNIEIERSVH